LRDGGEFSPIAAQVETVPPSARLLVATHDAFSNFADAYGFTVKGALTGLSTEETPSPARLAELVEQVKSAEVKAIFAETTTNPQLIEAIARDAGVEVGERPLLVEGPSGPGTDAPTYHLMLAHNTCSIINALGGQCDVETAPIQ
jgi:manganese/iron transport system substrate-binding protein